MGNPPYGIPGDADYIEPSVRGPSFDLVSAILLALCVTCAMLGVGYFVKDVVFAAQPEPAAVEDDAPGPIVVKEMPELGSYWPGRCIRVVDGDTIDVEVKKIVRVRLNVWCPEIHGPQREAGLKAKFTLAKAIENKMGVVVIPWKDSLKDELTLNRVLGRFVVNGDDAGGMMIRKKLGAATKEGLAEMYPE